MCDQYSAGEVKMREANTRVVSRFHAARAAGQQSIPSDDGEEESGDTPGQQGGKQAAAFRPGGGQQRVSSPRLEGSDEDMQPTSDEGADHPLAAEGGQGALDLLLGE